MQAIVGHTSRGLHELCATDVKKKKKKKKKATGNTSFESVSRLYNTGAFHRSASWGEKEKMGR